MITIRRTQGQTAIICDSCQRGSPTTWSMLLSQVCLRTAKSWWQDRVRIRIRRHSFQQHEKPIPKNPRFRICAGKVQAPVPPGLRFTEELTTFTNFTGFLHPLYAFYASLRPFTNHLLQNNNTNQRLYWFGFGAITLKIRLLKLIFLQALIHACSTPRYPDIQST